jgi:hypothetical protein
MILKGNERGHGAELALHLLNPRDNDHVTVHAIEGFVADDLAGALAEAEAISRATQCRNHLFSLSLNPPPHADVSVAVFEEAIARIEAKLGLTGQPRATVFHEKNGRHHAHCVWSRIEASGMRAINIAHSRRKLMDNARELYLEHGWDMPAGFIDQGLSDPLAFDPAEAGQAKRAARDPKALKAMFRECWERSDSRAAFAAALWAEGYCIAQGDRRGFVAVGADGKPWSLSRWCGVRPKELLARLGDPFDLPDVEEASRLMEVVPPGDRSATATAIATIKIDKGFEVRRQRLVAQQREERDALLAAQDDRRIDEQRSRVERLPRGLSALWGRLTGSHGRLLATFEREAQAAALRDSQERQDLIARHLRERRKLQQSRTASDIAVELDAIFKAAARRDPRQRLLLLPETLPFSSAQLIRDPALILHHLSHRQAQFTEAEVRRALSAHIDDLLILHRAIGAALAARELVRLDDGSLTTRDYQDAAGQLDADVTALRNQGGFAVAHHHVARAMAVQDTACCCCVHHSGGADAQGAPRDRQRKGAARRPGGMSLPCPGGADGAGRHARISAGRNNPV